MNIDTSSCGMRGGSRHKCALPQRAWDLPRLFGLLMKAASQSARSVAPACCLLCISFHDVAPAGLQMFPTTVRNTALVCPAAVPCDCC